MADKAVCGSCHAPAKSYGKTWRNDKGQYLTNIKPHMNVDGRACYARVGVVTGK